MTFLHTAIIMRRKAQQSNRTFMLGTFVLGILVIGIVIFFLALAFDMGAKNEHQKPGPSGDKYHFCLVPGFYPSGCDIFLNDSLIFSGIVTKDTTLSVTRMAEDNTVIVVDHSTEQMQLTEIAKKRGKFHLTLDDEGLLATEE